MSLQRKLFRRKGGGVNEIGVLSEWWKKSGESLQSLDDVLKKDLEKEKKEEEKLCFFHENTNRNLGEYKLKEADKGSGLFLIRTSAGAQDDFVLSLVHNKKYKHYKIKQKKINQFSIGTGSLHKGLDELANFYRHSAGGLACRLKTPCIGSLPPSYCRAQGYTNLLHKALNEGATDLAIAILNSQYCPDVNAKDSKGSTPLHEAATQGLHSVVDKLLEKKALVFITDAECYTPLQRACMNNHPAVVELLIVKGHADPQDQHPETSRVALHEAAYAGHLPCVMKLLALKTAAWPRDNKWLAPAELAEENNHQEVVKYLNEFTPAPAATSRADWFHEGVDRNGAIQLLRQHHLKDGLFLVRRSSKNTYVLVMTFDLNPYNFEINCMDGSAYYIDQSPLMPSLEHLIEYYCVRPDGLPCKLDTAITSAGKTKIMSISFIPETSLQSSGNNLILPLVKPVAKSPATSRKKKSTVPKPPTFPEPMQIDPKSIKLEYELGQGEYGSVLRGTWTTPDGEKHDVAIKTLHNEFGAANRENFLREAKVMVNLCHPCIVQLIGVCPGPSVMLVQELMPFGSLLDYLLDYPEEINVDTDLILWAAQIALGMQYLQEQKFVHRDLAARNILLASKKQVKIADFGLSRVLEDNYNYYKASGLGRWPIKWYAPECMNYGTFSSQSDVWSYGVTLWEMFTLGEPPYENMNGIQVCQLIEKGGRLEQPPKCPDTVYAKMRSCWEYKAEDRPSFKQLYYFFRERKDPNNPLVPEELMNAMGLSESSTHM